MGWRRRRRRRFRTRLHGWAWRRRREALPRSLHRRTGSVTGVEGLLSARGTGLSAPVTGWRESIWNELTTRSARGLPLKGHKLVLAAVLVVLRERGLPRELLLHLPPPCLLLLLELGVHLLKHWELSRLELGEDAVKGANRLLGDAWHRLARQAVLLLLLALLALLALLLALLLLAVGNLKGLIKIVAPQGLIDRGRGRRCDRAVRFTILVHHHLRLLLLLQINKELLKNITTLDATRTLLGLCRFRLASHSTQIVARGRLHDQRAPVPPATRRLAGWRGIGRIGRPKTNRRARRRRRPAPSAAGGGRR